MPRLQDFAALGQSIWYDYLRRSFIESGELKHMIDQGLRGVTANPSIFEHAIIGSVDYDGELEQLVAKNKSTDEIIETLMLDDIAKAADLFRPVYDSLEGTDGFVSIEVSPKLADDTQGMVAEARRFFYKLGRPNVMVKIPATEAGIPAVRKLISEGININITLIFSISQYRAVAEAYLDGIEAFAASGGNPAKVSSVASFFVSRVDTAVDRRLERLGDKSLQGKIAIDNAKLAYAQFREMFSGPRWERLKALGTRVQRPLWASTGTKNQAYSDTLYVDRLIGPDTVSTVPPATLRAVLSRGRAERTVDVGLDDSRADLLRLAALGVDLEEVASGLEKEGIEKFSKSIGSLRASISEKRMRFMAEMHHETGYLGEYQAAVESAIESMASKNVVHRIWAHDYTVWKEEPTEISDRLDWLHAPEIMHENIPRINELVEEVRSAGYAHVLLIGMGGSSLAAKVYSDVFGRREGYPELTVLDSVDPKTVKATLERLDLKRTLVIVSSKSGRTIETLSLMKYFHARMLEAVGERTGEHFVAITDPGTDLVSVAERNAFRACILNDPNIGGRYSALSYDGLVPAALIGVELTRLLDQAMNAVSACESCVDYRENPGAWLGAVLGELATKGKDKVTFSISPGFWSFGNWVEQLLAESTGKEGKGILPVVGEQLGLPDEYGDDRLFVSMQLEGDGDALDEMALARLKTAGHPIVQVRLHDKYELGREFFLWEMAVAVAGHIIAVNPFDQPNVESTKVKTREILAEYTANGVLPSPKPTLITSDITVFGGTAGDSPEAMLVGFLDAAKAGAYIAIQAYLPESAVIDRALLELRRNLMVRSRLATTVGYGPRFLHSTGQLHKGDRGRGLFIQITATSPGHDDISIPDELGSSKSSASFGVLEHGEALADGQALLDAGRSVIRYHINGDRIVEALNELTERSRDLAIPAG